MIDFIDTSLQLQSIITAHTLNSLWTTSVWRISLKILGLTWTSTTLEFTDELPFITATRPGQKSPCRTVNSLCYPVGCHGNLVFRNLLPGNDSFAAIRCNIIVAAETWLASRCSPMDVRSGSTIPAFSRHVTLSCAPCSNCNIFCFRILVISMKCFCVANIPLLFLPQLQSGINYHECFIFTTFTEGVSLCSYLVFMAHFNLWAWKYDNFIVKGSTLENRE
jgi:hypothetical protein